MITDDYLQDMVKSNHLTEEQSGESDTVNVLPHEYVMRHLTKMIYHNEDEVIESVIKGIFELQQISDEIDHDVSSELI